MKDLLERSDLAKALLVAAMEAGRRSDTLGTDEEADVWEDMRSGLLDHVETTEREDRNEVRVEDVEEGLTDMDHERIGE